LLILNLVVHALTFEVRTLYFGVLSQWTLSISPPQQTHLISKYIVIQYCSFHLLEWKQNQRVGPSFIQTYG